MLCRACRKAGYEPDEAGSGLEALQKVRSHSYSVITMDGAMHHMDGVDTVSVLRGESGVPIIAISAHLTAEIRGELSKRGVSYFIDKPFTLARVAEILAEAADGGSSD